MTERASRVTWTAETVLRLQTELSAEREKRYDERARYQEMLSDERNARYGERFNAQEQAAKVEGVQAERWRDQANEWRDAMNDRERNFLTKGMGYVLGFVALVSLVLTIFEKLSK